MGAPFPLAAEAAALGSSLLWAGAGVVFRRLRGRIDPAGLNLAKNTVATLCFAAVLVAAAGTPYPVSMPVAAQGWLVVSGVLGLSVCDTYLLRSMMEIGPRRATLLVLTAPVLVFLLAALPPFRQTAPLSNPMVVGGALLALGGVALAALEAPDLAVDAARVRRGVRDGLVAGVFQALGLLAARLGFSAGADPVEGAMVRLLAGTAGLVVLGLAGRRLLGWLAPMRHGKTLRTVATAAFFGTFLGIGLNQCALAWSDATGVVTTLNSLAPVWLIPLSFVFLGERHGRWAWISTGLAMAGVALLA